MRPDELLGEAEDDARSERERDDLEERYGSWLRMELRDRLSAIGFRTGQEERAFLATLLGREGLVYVSRLGPRTCLRALDALRARRGGWG